MSKVFISYKRVDREKAAFIRERLDALSVPLFIDDEIPARENFSFAINTHLNAAAAVLVLWTAASVKWPDAGQYNYVLAEAQYAAERGILVATFLEKLPPGALPVPFNTIQAPDISDWIETGGRAKHKQWQHVLRAIGALINRPSLPQLAVVLEEGDVEAKRSFLRSNPSDPVSARFASELEALERTEFEDRFQKAQGRVERRKTSAEKKLAECRNEFERRLEDLRAGRLFMPPDPIHVLGDNIRVLEEKTTFLSRQLEEQQSRAEEAESRVQRSAGDLSALGRELEEARQAVVAKAGQLDGLQAELTDAKGDVAARDRRIAALAATTTPALQSGRFGGFWAAGIAAVSLTLGVAAFPLFSRTGTLTDSAGQLSSLKAELDRQEHAVGLREQALAKAQEELEARSRTVAARGNTADQRDAAQKQKDRDFDAREARLTVRDGEQKTTAEELRKSQGDLAKAETGLSDREAQLTSQAAAVARREEDVGRRENSVRDLLASMPSASTGSLPAIGVVAQCDEWTAYQFDPDRPKATKFHADIADIQADQADQALHACADALAAANNDQVMKRRLTLQLGRAYAALGRNQALGGNFDAARKTFGAALDYWKRASVMNSSHAYNVLGTYYQGLFSVEKTTNGRFEPQPLDAALMWQNYSRSAQLGNPVAQTNAGVFLIGLDRRVSNFDSVVPRTDKTEKMGRDFLEAARKKDYPQAVYSIGAAMLEGLGGYPLDIDAGLRLIGEASCKGVVTDVFNKPKYRDRKPSCV